jgi:predicted NBD/HSP70 family sugar kinase
MNMQTNTSPVRPRITPPLDKDFRPTVLHNHSFLDVVHESGREEPLGIAIERNDGMNSVFKTIIFDEDCEESKANLAHAERLVKTLLWQWGGWKVIVGGPKYVGEHLQNEYSQRGKRSFDAEFMSNVYEKPFTVEVVDFDDLPQHKEKKVHIGGHLDGCRIGFDAGASDRKVVAVIEGEVVFSEEVIWDPKSQRNPQYHFDEIMNALRTAAAHMPKVDAIGVSAAGIYIDNQVRVSSLFRGVRDELYENGVKNLFLDIQEKWEKTSLEVINDGDVTALAGAMTLNKTGILGIALGSSEAGGYIDRNGNITGWLNELAFVPVDSNPWAAIDEWSGDRGCGAQYFSQEAVVRLAPVSGIILDEKQTSAEKLKHVQRLLSNGDERGIRIFETIGCYVGYGIAHYADFYDINHILILGRVTSGDGGNIILSKVEEVLRLEFPDLAADIEVHLPDESQRRVGQAIAAASLPEIK